jgi:hypothetical protein
MPFVSMIFSAILTLCSTMLYAQAMPGEKAAYLLDSSRQRTSALIQKGNFDVGVVDHVPQHPQGDSFKLSYDYKLSVLFAGDRAGNGTFDMLGQYLTKEFLEKVKKDEVISTENFKIKYLGTEDVTTAQGKNYEKCDLILIYDVNLQRLNPQHGLLELVSALVPEGETVQLAEFEQLKVKAAIKHGSVPVFGAAKIDLSALVRGMQVRAGFDYTAPGASHTKN